MTERDSPCEEKRAVPSGSGAVNVALVSKHVEAAGHGVAGDTGVSCILETSSSVSEVLSSDIKQDTQNGIRQQAEGIIALSSCALAGNATVRNDADPVDLVTMRECDVADSERHCGASNLKLVAHADGSVGKEEVCSPRDASVMACDAGNAWEHAVNVAFNIEPNAALREGEGCTNTTDDNGVDFTAVSESFHHGTVANNSCANEVCVLSDPAVFAQDTPANSFTLIGDDATGGRRPNVAGQFCEHDFHTDSGEPVRMAGSEDTESDACTVNDHEDEVAERSGPCLASVVTADNSCDQGVDASERTLDGASDAEGSSCVVDDHEVDGESVGCALKNEATGDSPCEKDIGASAERALIGAMAVQGDSCVVTGIEVDVGESGASCPAGRVGFLEHGVDVSDRALDGSSDVEVSSCVVNGQEVDVGESGAFETGRDNSCEKGIGSYAERTLVDAMTVPSDTCVARGIEVDFGESGASCLAAVDVDSCEQGVDASAERPLTSTILNHETGSTATCQVAAGRDYLLDVVTSSDLQRRGSVDDPANLGTKQCGMTDNGTVCWKSEQPYCDAQIVTDASHCAGHTADDQFKLLDGVVGSIGDNCPKRSDSSADVSELWNVKLASAIASERPTTKEIAKDALGINDRIYRGRGWTYTLGPRETCSINAVMPTRMSWSVKVEGLDVSELTLRVILHHADHQETLEHGQVFKSSGSASGIAGEGTLSIDLKNGSRAQAVEVFLSHTEKPHRLITRSSAPSMLHAISKAVAATFIKMSEPLKADKLQVLEVQRVEHPDLWDAYVRRRDEIAAGLRENGSGLVSVPVQTDPFFSCDDSSNERWLFHGTLPSAGRSIAASGFAPDARSARGTLFGKGVYFTECASKADLYATPFIERPGATDGLLCLLLCRVTLGRVMSSDALRPDVSKIQEALRCGSAHSFLGDRRLHNSYREFVVTDTAQAYPEWVIWYRRLDHGWWKTWWTNTFGQGFFFDLGA